MGASLDICESQTKQIMQENITNAEYTDDDMQFHCNLNVTALMILKGNALASVMIQRMSAM